MVRLFLEYISSKLILDQCLAKASFLKGPQLNVYVIPQSTICPWLSP